MANPNAANSVQPRRGMSNVVWTRSLFGEGGYIDALDKAISMPLFKLEVPESVELVWSYPALWFGIPSIGQGVIALVVATYADSSPHKSLMHNLSSPLALTTVGIVAVAAARHLQLSLQSQKLTESQYTDSGIVYLYVPVPSKPKTLILTAIAAPHLALALTKVLASPAGHEAACYYLLNWSATLIVTMSAKIAASRQRPAFILSPEEGGHRYFPQHQWFLRQPMTRFGSFPSGDAAMAGAFYFSTNHLFNSAHWNIASKCAFTLALSGRMFFHAHHALDVIFGGVTAYVVSQGIQTFLPVAQVSWHHLLLVQSSFFFINKAKSYTMKKED